MTYKKYVESLTDAFSEKKNFREKSLIIDIIWTTVGKTTDINKTLNRAC